MTDTRRIRLLVAVGGHDFSWTPGQVVDLPGDEAEKWADGVRAEYHEEQPVEQPEQDTKPGRHRGGQQVETTESASKPASTRKTRRTASTTETT